MDFFEFSLLPPEIQLHILRNTDPMTLTRLCRASSQYKSICSGEYDYLWRILVFEMIDSMYNYRDIHVYNEVNKRKFRNWYEVYVYFCKLNSIIKVNKLVIQASERGSIEEIKYLVSKGKDIHLYDDEALRLAATNGHLDVVKYLISLGANIHSKDDEALRQAALHGYLDVVKYLISLGANIHARDDEAFIQAASNGHLDVVKYLVSQGENIHAQNNKALERAILFRNLDVAEYLQQFN